MRRRAVRRAQRTYFRVTVAPARIDWSGPALAMAMFLQAGSPILKWTSLLAALLLTSSAFSIAAALINVSAFVDFWQVAVRVFANHDGS